MLIFPWLFNIVFIPCLFYILVYSATSVFLVLEINSWNGNWNWSKSNSPNPNFLPKHGWVRCVRDITGFIAQAKDCPFVIRSESTLVALSPELVFKCFDSIPGHTYGCLSYWMSHRLCHAMSNPLHWFRSRFWSPMHVIAFHPRDSLIVWNDCLSWRTSVASS